MTASIIALAPLLSAGDAMTFAAAAVGAAGQWLKAQKRFPTYVASGILLGVGFAFYVLSHPYNGEHGWLSDGLMWASGLPGIASMSASVGVAPKTDSKP